MVSKESSRKSVRSRIGQRSLLILFAFFATMPFTALAEEETQTSTSFIPIPIYSTRPSEGSTFGIMPVFMVVRSGTKEVASIYAPSLSYNKIIQYTGTFRWFQYPSPDKTLELVASVSTKTNWNAHLYYNRLPSSQGDSTDEVSIYTERNIFYRFFGFGPDTTKDAETSYTRVRGTVGYRRGYNLTRRLNLGARIEASSDKIEAIGVPEKPLSADTFPDAPGMRGSSVIGEFIDLRFDSRSNREYSLKGFYSGVQAGFVQGIWNSPGYFQAQFESTALIPETTWLQGGARIFSRWISRDDAPFYHQSSLGGSDLLRGFIESRFIDRNAWTAEIEQRIRILQTNIFGVIADWRIDPFIAVGQVYSDSKRAFDRVRVTEGVGFRAWIRPNITGRVDLGYGGEGLKVYVELGYPF